MISLCLEVYYSRTRSCFNPNIYTLNCATVHPKTSFNLLSAKMTSAQTHPRRDAKLTRRHAASRTPSPLLLPPPLVPHVPRNAYLALPNVNDSYQGPPTREQLELRLQRTLQLLDEVTSTSNSNGHCFMDQAHREVTSTSEGNGHGFTDRAHHVAEQFDVSLSLVLNTLF